MGDFTRIVENNEGKIKDKTDPDSLLLEFRNEPDARRVAAMMMTAGIVSSVSLEQ
jgi:hypothetical protein